MLQKVLLGRAWWIDLALVSGALFAALLMTSGFGANAQTARPSCAKPDHQYYKGRAEFTSEEKSKHRQEAQAFSGIAAQCLKAYENEHLAFYYSTCNQYKGKEVCLSKYYGDRKFSKSKGEKRRDGTELIYLGDALAEAGFAPSYMNYMEPISCVGMTINCLREAFTKTDQSSAWEKVLKFTKENGVGGTALQEALRELGWKVYYWNPSSQALSDASAWDAEESGWGSRGYHASCYRAATEYGKYWYNTVDDATSLVGFERGEPDILKSAPFWVGTAHVGYHVFPGTYADVVEAHSTRKITAVDNLEFSKFSPFATGGGPRWTATEKYRSGLIAIPPL